MRVVIQENYDNMSKWTANYIAAKIKAHKEDRPFVLGLPTGSSPIGVYNELVRMYKAGEISFKNVVTFNMVDVPKENINILNGMAEDLEAECAAYEAKIASYGGIDLFLGGIGVDGHIAFNEPGTSLASRTGLRKLTRDTRIVNSRFFDNDPEKVPAYALCTGVATIMDAKEVIIEISGHNKARAMAHVIEGGISQMWTCSCLQMHENAIIACDEPACDELKVGTYKFYLDIEKDERL